MKLKVSIIVPVYNVEKYLPRCMDSILNQSLKDIEIILVDDGSPDNCPALCDEYAANDDRVKVIHKKNAGLGFARNSGLEKACGKFVAFVDSDDYVKETMYEELYNEAIEAGSDAVFCNLSRVDSDGNVFDSIEEKGKVNYNGKDEIFHLLLNMVGTIPSHYSDRLFNMSACHAIYKLADIKDNNIRFRSEREVFSEDLIFHIDYLPLVNRVTYINTCNYYYCENAGSLTKTLKKDRFKKNIVLHKTIIELVALKYPGKEGEVALRADRLLIGYVRSMCIRFTISITSIRSICIDDYFAVVLHRYPSHDLPFKYRVFVSLQKRKMYFVIYLLSILLGLISKKTTRTTSTQLDF